MTDDYWKKMNKKKKLQLGYRTFFFFQTHFGLKASEMGEDRHCLQMPHVLTFSPTLTPPAKIKPNLNKIWTVQEMMFTNRTKSGKSHSSQRFFLFLPLHANAGLFSAFHFDGQQRAFWVKVFFTLWTRRPDCRSCRLGYIRAGRADRLFKGRANRSPGQVFPIWN